LPRCQLILNWIISSFSPALFILLFPPNHMNINIHYIKNSSLRSLNKTIEDLMNKWNTITSLIKKKDFEGLQDILHDEYLYLRETTLISKDEMVEFIKKRFEDGLTFESLELIIEDKDLLAWRDILLEHGGKRWETTNVQIWKDKKVWRDIVSVRDLEKEDRI